MNLLMDRMSREEINKRVLSACESGFNIEEQDEFGIDVYDDYEDWFIRYRYLETLDVQNLVEFNSLKVDEAKFWRLFDACIDYNSLMTIEKIVFVSNEDELDKWEASVNYEHSFDMNNAIGIMWLRANIVIVNASLISHMVMEDDIMYGVANVNEAISMGLMETLVHELRHVLTTNPIITEDLIPAGEEEEDAVEEYCRAVTHNILIGHPDLVFVK